LFYQGGRGGGFRNRINNLAERFRQSGATSVETAKTPEEIGLPPQFYQAMHRRLGQTGIFVEVNGKYYLDEARFARFNQSGFGGRGMGRGGGQNYQARQSLLTLRIIRITLSIVVLLLIIGNLLYFHSFYTWIAIIFLFILTIVISIAQIFYLSRLRRNRNF
jgi:hypothetical protein